jgi:pilus assembly protein TadC
MTFFLLERLARLLPKRIQTWSEIHVRLAGYTSREEPLSWLAKGIILVLMGGILGGIVGWMGTPFLNAWISTVFTPTLFPKIVYALVGILVGGGLVTILRGLSIYYAIERRRSAVEEILPDFLLLVAGNIRAGMTSFSAFKSSTRPEFGALAEEVRTVTARSLGTGSFGNALTVISENIRSKSLSESVRFFLQAVRSGGKVAQILENTSTDLRRTQDLKKELESGTRTYVIFVAFVMVIATPLLMAVSVSFVELITRIQSQSGLSAAGVETAGLGFLGGNLTISAAFLEGMAYILLIGNALLAGLFMGTIGGGKPLLGMRYTPFMFIASVLVFWVAKGVLSGLLGG